MHRVASLLLIASLAGCGGGGGGASSVPAPGSGSLGQTTAQFTITIPLKAAQTVKYVSASTQSVIITLNTVNSAPYVGTSTAPASVATNLNSSSPSCAPSGGNLVCTAAATSVAGADAYSITMYDATQSSTSPASPAGNVLSQGTTILPVTAGQTNTGSLTLTGTVASLAIAFAANAHVSGSVGAGFSVVGNQPRTFTVSALDADGNTIVGPGAPTFTVSSGNAAVAIAGSSGTYTAQTQSYSATPVQITVTPSNGAVVHFNVSTIQEMWVSNSGGNTVTGYNGATNAQIAGDTITGLNAPFFVQIGPNGNLWISNFTGNSVEEVVPETNTAVLTIAGGSTGLSGAFNSTFDGTGNLYVSNGSSNALSKFSAASFAGLTGTQNIAPATTTSTNISDPVQSAFDGSGVLWVANNGSSQISAYDSSLTSVALIGGGNTNLSGPTGVAFDSGGHLWVVNNASNNVEEFSTTGITLVNGNIAPLTTISGGSTGLNNPVGLAFDASGNLWVGNRVPNTAIEYAAGSLAAGGNLAPIATVAAGSGASGITFTP